MTRPGMEIIDGVEIIDHLALPRVGIKDVLEALNAARVAAGWEPIADLPMGRVGIRTNPVALALDCSVAEHWFAGGMFPEYVDPFGTDEEYEEAETSTAIDTKYLTDLINQIRVNNDMYPIIDLHQIVFSEEFDPDSQYFNPNLEATSVEVIDNPSASKEGL